MKGFKEALRFLVPSTQRQRALELTDLASSEGVKEWIYGSDAQYGGFSTCTLDIDEVNSAAVFQGSISTKLPEKVMFSGQSLFQQKRRIVRSGFAACNVEVNWAKRLSLAMEFDAIQIVGRGDSKIYKLNITPNSYSPDDLYQCLFKFSSSTEWQTRTIPFDKLLLTRSGQRLNTQRAFNGKIRKIGISIADEQEGPFKIELKSICLVNDELLKAEDFQKQLK